MPDIHKCPCGVEFETSPQQRWQVKNRPKHRIFCSPECSKKARKISRVRIKFKTCAGCGKKFALSRNQRAKIAREPRRRVACSPECVRSLARTQKSKSKPKQEEIPTPKPWRHRPAPSIPPWIPYAGVGARDFPALHDPF